MIKYVLSILSLLFSFFIVCYSGETLDTNVRQFHLCLVCVLIKALIYSQQSHDLGQSGVFSEWYKLPPKQNFYVKMIHRIRDFRNQLTIGKMGTLSMELYSNVSVLF